MGNIRLTVSYDGTRYLGWQDVGMCPSIEGTLREVIERILQQPVVLQAASRTDAGVHARGQVVNFFCPKALDPTKLRRSINSLLPDDIAVKDIETASEAFHPTLDAKGKEYGYWICNGPVQKPHHRHFSWHYPYPLDREAMVRAAAHLVGEHDFAAFCNSKKNHTYSSTVRCVYSIDIIESGEERLKIVIKGQNFLYKMVRNIVGTLVYVGCGKLSVEDVAIILSSRDREVSGMTAPAHGLTLEKVYYP